MRTDTDRFIEAADEVERLQAEIARLRHENDLMGEDLQNFPRLRRIEEAARELHIESQVQEGRVVRVKRSRYLKLRAALNEEGE